MAPFSQLRFDLGTAVARAIDAPPVGVPGPLVQGNLRFHLSQALDGCAQIPGPSAEGLAHEIARVLLSPPCFRASDRITPVCR